MTLNQLNYGNGTAALLLNDNSIYMDIDSLINEVRFIVSDFNENPSKEMIELRDWFISLLKSIPI